MVRRFFLNRGFLFLLVLLIVFFSVASSLISVVERPFVEYNVGDSVEFVFLIEEEAKVADYVEVDLVCGEERENVFRGFASFVSEDLKEFSVVFFAKQEGVCFLDVRFLNYSYESESFEVFSELIVDVSLNKNNFVPGDEVFVSGRVYKINSEVFDYSADISVGDFYMKRSSFGDSDFETSFFIDRSVVSGVYELLIVFEEKGFTGEVINSGIYLTNISVLSGASVLDVLFDSEVEPGSNFSFVARVFDDDGNLIENKEVEFKIFDSRGRLYFDEVVLSGEENNVFFESDLDAGDWRFSANYDEFLFEDNFVVGEKVMISMDFVNKSSYVVFKNMGNSFFDDRVELVLVNESGLFSVFFDLSIGAGESVEREIGHYGFYDLRFGEVVFEGVYVSRSRSFFGSFFGFVFRFFLVLFLLLIFGSLVYFVYFYFFVFGERGRNNFDKRVKEKILYSGKKRKGFFSDKNEMAVEKSSLKRVVSLRDDSFDDIFSEVKKTGDIGDSDYFKDSIDLNSSNLDIPFVKNALKESSKQLLYSNQKVKKSDSNVSRVYCLFFRKSDSKELAGVLQRYRMGFYRSGDMGFSLFRSSKPSEKMLFNICKVIVNKTDNHDVLIHSMSVDESKNLSRFFKGFKDFLKEGEGIIVSERIYARLENKIDFSFFKNYNDNGNLIRFYKFDG